MNYAHASHSHCWSQKQPPACGIPLDDHKQCCLCDLTYPMNPLQDPPVNTAQDWIAPTAQAIVDMFFEAGARIGIQEYKVVKNALTSSFERGRLQGIEEAVEYIKANGFQRQEEATQTFVILMSKLEAARGLKGN